ncbi:MAG: hypothetical protein AB8G77_28780 [Rhodothermales bacterium]
MGLILGYFLSRFGFSAYVRKKERAAEKLMRQLDDMIDEPAQVSRVTETEGGRIELPDVDIEAPAGSKEANREKS